MIEVLFFASIRERLGVSRLSVQLTGQTQSLAAFTRQLIESHESGWAEVLLADNVVTAVNQQVVNKDYQLSAGDELAYFPPVTGG